MRRSTPFPVSSGVAERNDDLGATLQQAIETPVDRDLTARFLYFLRHDYLVPLDRNNVAASDPKAAVEKILKALG